MAQLMADDIHQHKTALTKMLIITNTSDPVRRLR